MLILLSISIRTCSQQTNADDCGCYALAYTATIALGGT